MDLLHHLLKREAGVAIVEVTPGNNIEDVVAGLNVLTEILNKLKNGE